VLTKICLAITTPPHLVILMRLNLFLRILHIIHKILLMWCRQIIQVSSLLMISLFLSCKNYRNRISHYRTYRCWSRYRCRFRSSYIRCGKKFIFKRTTILGFAFSEATGLFALMMAFLLLYVA